MNPLPDSKARDRPYFLGTATPDTVPAGPDEAPRRKVEGHFGLSGNARRLYGQIVMVHRVGGDTTRFKPGARVVVVPWDYDPACRPIPWGLSAAWVPTSGQRFFFPRLRPESLWVSGLPTFDAFTPESDVFPSRYPSPVFPNEGKPTDPETLFEFYESMPIVDSANPVTDAERNRLMTWAQNHPDALKQWPIERRLQVLTGADGEYRGLRRARAMMGTYRLLLTAPQGESRVALLRVAACVREDHWMNRKRQSADPLAYEKIGARLRYWVALNEADLESTDLNRRRGTQEWHVGWLDAERPDSAWMAEINPRQFRQLWGNDPVMKAVFRYRDNWFGRHWGDQNLPEWYGAFVPGESRFTQTIPLRDGGTLTLVAERISETTSPCSSEQILTDDPSLPNPPRRDSTRH